MGENGGNSIILVAIPTSSEILRTVVVVSSLTFKEFRMWRHPHLDFQTDIFGPLSVSHNILSNFLIQHFYLSTLIEAVIEQNSEFKRKNDGLGRVVQKYQSRIQPRG